MAIPTAASVADLIVAQLGDNDPRSRAAWVIVVEQILTAVKAADVLPGGTPIAMNVPVSGAGVPVLGKGILV